LIALGFDAAESDALLALEDAKVERQRITEREAVTHAQLLAGRITADAARNALTIAGTPPERVTLLVERWQVERDERTPDVPLAALEELAQEGLIERGALLAELERRGYADHEARWLADLWGLHTMVAERRLAIQERAIVSREQQTAARLAAQRDIEAERTSRAFTLADIREQSAQQRTAQQRAGQLEVVARQIEARERLAQSQAQAQGSLLERRLASQASLQSERLTATAGLQEQRLAVQQSIAEARNALQRSRLEVQLTALDRRIAASERLQEARASAQSRLLEQRAGYATAASERADVRRIAAEKRLEARTIGGETRKYVRELETRGLSLAEKQRSGSAVALSSVQTPCAICSVGR
jgi:hypothetical protein